MELISFLSSTFLLVGISFCSFNKLVKTLICFFLAYFSCYSETLISALCNTKSDLGARNVDINMNMNFEYVLYHNYF